MILLYIAFAIVFIRAMLGWEIKFSRRRVVPAKRARIIALACLPALAVGSDERLFSLGILAYCLAFCLAAGIASVSINRA